MQQFSFYEAQRNSDQTEGRGSMIPLGRYVKLEDALKAVKGQGVMGVGDGDVVQVHYIVQGDEVIRQVNRIYGWRKDWNDRWNHGFIDLRDAPANDPEYDEYMRLKKKFGG